MSEIVFDYNVQEDDADVLASVTPKVVTEYFRHLSDDDMPLFFTLSDVLDRLDEWADNPNRSYKHTYQIQLEADIDMDVEVGFELQHADVEPVIGPKNLYDEQVSRLLIEASKKFTLEQLEKRLQT